MTARDTLVALLGEAKADEVIEQAARAEYASDRTAGEDWDREGAEYRDLYLMPVTAALAAVLPGLLAPEVITERKPTRCRTGSWCWTLTERGGMTPV